MREFLLSGISIFLWVFMAFHLIFFVLLRRRFMDTKNVLFLLAAVLGFGLFFNAMATAFGSFLDPEAGLRSVARAQWIFRSTLMPLILPICVYAMDVDALARRLLSILTVVLVGMGLATGILTKLEPVSFGTLTVMAESAATAPWIIAYSRIVNYCLMGILVLSGNVVLAKQKNPSILVAGAALLIFNLLGPITGNADLTFLIRNPGEVLMILFLYAYAENRYYNEFMEANK